MIAPADRRIHRLLAFRKVARTRRREQHVVLEAAQQIFDGQDLDPARRQFERERQRIQTPADCGHGCGVCRTQPEVRLDVPDSFHEQPDRGSASEIRERRSRGVRIQRERTDRVLTFPPNVKRGAAGHDESQRRDRGQQVGNERRRRDHLLEIIEYQQSGPAVAGRTRAPRQIDRGDVGKAERFGNRRCHEHRLPNGGERDEDDARGTFFRDHTRELQGQARLADTSGTYQRDQARGRTGERAHRARTSASRPSSAVNGSGSGTPPSPSDAAS